MLLIFHASGMYNLPPEFPVYKIWGYFHITAEILNILLQSIIHKKYFFSYAAMI